MYTPTLMRSLTLKPSRLKISPQGQGFDAPQAKLEAHATTGSEVLNCGPTPLTFSAPGSAVNVAALATIRSQSPGEFVCTSPVDLYGPLVARVCQIASSSLVTCKPRR